MFSRLLPGVHAMWQRCQGAMPCVPVRPPQQPLQQLLQRCNLRSVPRSDWHQLMWVSQLEAYHGIPRYSNHCFPLSNRSNIRMVWWSPGLLPASTAPSNGTWLRGFAPHADSASLVTGTATQREKVQRFLSVFIGFYLFLSVFPLPICRVRQRH